MMRGAALLEPLGVALHATTLAKIQKGSRVAILGAGPIGLLLIQTAKLAGAGEIFVSDPLAWRVKLARKFGARPLPKRVEVDVVLEAAWGGEAIEQSLEIVRPAADAASCWSASPRKITAPASSTRLPAEKV